MKRTKIVVRRVEVVRAVLCNKCGKACPQFVPDQFEFATLATDWGYGSHRDGEREESHLCEACCDEIVSSFKIKPTTIRSAGIIID